MIGRILKGPSSTKVWFKGKVQKVGLTASYEMPFDFIAFFSGTFGTKGRTFKK